MLRVILLTVLVLVSGPTFASYEAPPCDNNYGALGKPCIDESEVPLVTQFGVGVGSMTSKQLINVKEATLKYLDDSQCQITVSGEYVNLSNISMQIDPEKKALADDTGKFFSAKGKKIHLSPGVSSDFSYRFVIPREALQDALYLVHRAHSNPRNFASQYEIKWRIQIKSAFGECAPGVKTDVLW